VAPREYLRAKLQARLAAKRRAPDDAFMTIAEASSREVDEVLAALDTSREGRPISSGSRRRSWFTAR
jgi:hypothetical protein